MNFLLCQINPFRVILPLQPNFYIIRLSSCNVGVWNKLKFTRPGGWGFRPPICLHTSPLHFNTGHIETNIEEFSVFRLGLLQPRSEPRLRLPQQRVHGLRLPGLQPGENIYPWHGIMISLSPRGHRRVTDVWRPTLAWAWRGCPPPSPAWGSAPTRSQTRCPWPGTGCRVSPAAPPSPAQTAR